MRPFVVYWNNIPSPYMVERFNALADRGVVEFEAWFNDRSNLERSWEVNEKGWRFQYRYLPVTELGKWRCHWPVSLFGRRPDLLVSLYANSSFVMGWGLAKLCGVKTGFRVLMTHDSWVTRHPVKERMKRFLFRHVDAIETPGRDGKAYAMRYGASGSKIYFVTHTIDIPHIQYGVAKAVPERELLRHELGLKGITFIYVGRLWSGKGLSYLLKAFEIIQGKLVNPVSLLLVGNGPEEAQLRQECVDRHIHNVVWAGYKQKPELPSYYALADVFVFPTIGDPYGLVVDEAMAAALPVISTSAAGEIDDRIENGVNGYIVPPQNASALAEPMLKLACDSVLREQMGRISARKIANHTPDQWAKDFERLIHSVLDRGVDHANS